MKKYLILSLAIFLLSFTVNDDVNWIQKADFGGGKIYNPTTFVIGNYAYVATGSNNPVYGSGLQRFLYRYDPSLDVWKRMADLPPAASATFMAIGFAIGEKGYVCGGANVAKLWEYDPLSNLWYQRKNFPRVIEEGIGFSISSKAYVGLGGAIVGDYKNDFYEYDQSKNNWTQLNDFPGAPRRGSIGFSMNGKGYAGLGYKDIGSFKKSYFNDLWEYDPLTDDWTRLPDFPGEAREDAIGFGIDGAIYIGMGAINDFYRYDLNTKEWTPLNYIPGNPRVNAFSFCIDSGIYYGGGMSPNLASDMWSYSYKRVNTRVLTNEVDSFKSFPNPVVDVMEIELPHNNLITKLILTDLSGKLIYECDHIGTSRVLLDFNGYAKGYYILKVLGQNGKSFSKKILKI
jgi:N-acetylneuraminic acid mutarotase